MKRVSGFLLVLLVIQALTANILSGIDTKNTRMMSQPAISGSHIAFIYAEDLWIANLDVFPEWRFALWSP